MPHPIDRRSGGHDVQRLDLSLRRQVQRLHVGREPIHRNGHPVCRLLSALLRDRFRQLELAFLVHGSEFAAHRLAGFCLGVVVPGSVQVPLENVAPSEVVDRVADLDLVCRNVVGQEGAHGVFQGDDGSFPALQSFDRCIRHPIGLERQGKDLHAIVDGRRERRSRDELFRGGLPGFQNSLGHELRLQLILKPFGEGVVRFDDRTETGGHGIVKSDVFFRWHGPGKLPCPVFPGLPVHHRPVVNALERTLAPVELAVLGHARSDDRLEWKPPSRHGVRQFFRTHVQIADGRLGVEAHVPCTLRPGRREVPRPVELRHEVSEECASRRLFAGCQVRLIHDEDPIRSNGHERLALDVRHLQLGVGQEHGIRRRRKLPRCCDLLQILAPGSRGTERPLHHVAIQDFDVRPVVDQVRLQEPVVSAVDRFLVHIGEKHRIRRQEDGDLPVLDRPTDHHVGLAPLANAGVVGDDRRLAVLHVRDRAGHRLRLEPHQRGSKLLRLVSKLLLEECFHVSHVFPEPCFSGFHPLLQVGGDEHALVQFRQVWLGRVRLGQGFQVYRIIDRASSTVRSDRFSICCRCSSGSGIRSVSW